MIVMVDYGMGNLRSVAKAFDRVGSGLVLASDKKTISLADKLVLPGVGHFKKGIDNIRQLGIEEVLKDKILRDNCPILGICLGMQLLSHFSEEGNETGLSLINSTTKRFELNKLNGNKIPHMGWNSLKIKRQGNILKKIPEDSVFYFVHSYYVKCVDSIDSIASTNYGIEFTSVIERNNIFATQFHPEKSHDAGLQIIRNFTNI